MHLCTHMVRVWALLFVSVLRALSCAHSERVWVRARACVLFFCFRYCITTFTSLAMKSVCEQATHLFNYPTVILINK